MLLIYFASDYPRGFVRNDRRVLLHQADYCALIHDSVCQRVVWRSNLSLPVTDFLCFARGYKKHIRNQYSHPNQCNERIYLSPWMLAWKRMPRISLIFAHLSLSFLHIPPNSYICNKPREISRLYYKTATFPDILPILFIRVKKWLAISVNFTDCTVISRIFLQQNRVMGMHTGHKILPYLTIIYYLSWEYYHFNVLYVGCI